MRTNQIYTSRSRAAVYLLQRLDRQRFKIGWSVSPMRRIHQLPEYAAGQLDLNASVAAWLPDRKRAEQIEDAVHKTLAPYAAEVDHRMDGHSEWFKQVAQPMAMRLLSQAPLDERTDRLARLTPVQAKAPLADAVSIETGPQDCWWQLEDLWLRLAMHCRMTVEREGDVHTLVIRGFMQDWARTGPVGALRMTVLDPTTYGWSATGTKGAFLQWIDKRDDDLICRFVSLGHIESWPDGQELVWQIEGFLMRPHRMPIPGRIAALATGAK
jgi:hypothetical protein